MTSRSTRAKKIPPVSPGEFLSEEYLKPLGMNMNQLRACATRAG